VALENILPPTGVEIVAGVALVFSFFGLLHGLVFLPALRSTTSACRAAIFSLAPPDVSNVGVEAGQLTVVAKIAASALYRVIGVRNRGQLSVG
jgi:hypothetical protein